jgi:protein O-mannosyl-transferase
MYSTQQLSKDCKEIEISHCRKVVFAVLSLAIILLAVYGNSFNCSWHFDDEPNITTNPNLHMTELSREQIGRALKSDRNSPHSLYRPVACLSFALNHYFGDLNVFGYHLVNLVIHFLSSIFLFLFILNTLQLTSLKGRYSSNAYEIALLATVLWAINPIQTQAVTYIVQRMAALAAMFYILSMYFYLKARTVEGTQPKIAFFVSSGLSFLLALGSKENAAMLPMSLFLYEAIVLQEDTRAFFRKNVKWFALTLSFIALIGLLYFFSKHGNIFSFLKGYENRPFTLAERLLTQPRIFIFYITLLLYPMPNRLSIAHSFELSTSLFEPVTTFFAILFVFGLIAFSLAIARKSPLFAYCILFFVVNHFIESTIFSLELVFEHRNYLPSMLFFIPVAAGLCYLLDHFSNRKRMKYVLSAFIVLLLVGLGNSTFMRNFTWRNGESLWIDASEKAPGESRVHHNLGRFYQDHGFRQAAIEEYKKALQAPVGHRRDEEIVTHYNLAKLFTDLGDTQVAKTHYEKAIAMNPRFIPALNNLAALLDRLGETESANALLRRVLEFDPCDGHANLNTGLHYLRIKEHDKAIQHLTKARESVALEGDRLLYLGIAYKQRGEYGRSSIYLRRALDLRHRAMDAHLHLAEVYARTGLPAKAELEAEKAIELLMEDKRHPYRIIRQMTEPAETLHAEPALEIILPFISKVLGKRSAELNELEELIDETLHHLAGVERP